MIQKQYISLIAAALSAVLLCACASRKEAPVQTTPSSAPLPEVTETAAPTTSPEADAAMQAFRKALHTIHDDLVWPDLDEENGKIQIFEPATIDDEQFAIFDVDGDGEQELLVSVSNTYMAGMRLAVYGYDAPRDDLKLEAVGFPAVTFYPGMIKMLSSHNQGHAGDVLWPYGILVYDPAADGYHFKCSVDAWDRNLSETDFAGNPFPTDIDVDNLGHVYLITDDDGDLTLNQADYEAWESALLAGKEELEIPWQKLTAENIG